MGKAARIAAAAAPLGVAAVALARSRRRSTPPRPYHGARQRVLVLGAGFGGFGAATGIARRARDGTAVLAVDRHDFLTFWPMVPEVIAGSIEVQHALRPLAAELSRAGVSFLRGEVESIDVDSRVVKTSAGDFGYDKLVVALGWRTNHFDVEGAEQHSLGVESIEDAIRIRDRVIDQLERATAQALAGHTPDAGLLEFVVVGGGSTGVEVAANLRGLLDDLLPSYPALRRGPTSVHLLQAAGAVLPHMDSRLRRVAAARLDAEAIAVQTNAVAAAIDPDGVRLSDGSRIDARTVVWAAGVKAAPALGLPVDDKGRVKVDDCLRVEGRHGMYALGDIAAVTSDGHPVPPTAQAAVQEADCVAANLVRELRHEAPEPFRFRYMGQLVDLGSRFAVSQVMGRKFSGGFAQLLWRAVYLYKLGGRGERARVVSDWLLDAVSGPRVTRLPLA